MPISLEAQVTNSTTIDLSKAEVGLEPRVLESDSRRANVIARIEGEDPSREALLLHGHLDVVPFNAGDWTHDPLSGEIAVGGTRKGRIRSGLVVIQVAVCTVVLIGVGLCFRSLNNLERVDLGFSPRNVATLTLDFRANGYSEEQGRNMYARMREAAAQI